MSGSQVSLMRCRGSLGGVPHEHAAAEALAHPAGEGGARAETPRGAGGCRGLAGPASFGSWLRRADRARQRQRAGLAHPRGSQCAAAR
eukprot:5385697-Prorocentrum_lima.AAC.1